MKIEVTRGGRGAWQVTRARACEEAVNGPATASNCTAAATGEAYLTMFEYEYSAMVDRMERGDSVATAWSAATGAKPYTTVRPWVIADPAAPSRVLVDALTRAREQQVEALLTVTEPDGTVRYYQALPDGTLHGDPVDGGFAVVAALATRGVTIDSHPPAFPVTQISWYGEESASARGTTGTAMVGTFAGGSS